MGNHSSTPMSNCLDAVCAGRSGCVAYPYDLLYQEEWVNVYNLNIPVTPVAVVRPNTTSDVSGFVKCAATNGVKVQAKSGGHSYGNFGDGGVDGALVIDMLNFQQFQMDTSTWQATVGSGTRLGDLDTRLHANGERAMPHGTCPGVGIGGHATIGGMGPSSRMWGLALDQVVEVEVVTADGTVQRASETENPDLFWALKGAGAGYGVITEFVVKTYPAPGSVVQYAYSIDFGSLSSMASLYQAWQDLIADPNLDPRFASEFVVFEDGSTITVNFYGTEAEFNATGIPARIPAKPSSIVINDYLGALAAQAEDAALYLSEVRAEFTAKSLAFRPQDLLSPGAIASLFDYMDQADKGTLLWFLIFDLEGGVINDVAHNATAYPHRDKLMFIQAYGIGLPTLGSSTEAFIGGITSNVLASVPAINSTYAGYVDPTLADGQSWYWSSHLAQLEQVKRARDPTDLFHNPQSVRCAS